MTLWPVAAALPWLAAPNIILLRARHSRSLDEVPAAPPEAPPLVSVVIPARDEARHIARCVRSVLASTWPALEVVVVDDRSTDGTGDIARGLAATDARLRVVESPPLAEGWFGKQWACAQGAAATRGAILCFTDADTVHAPDLAARAVRMLAARDASLLSVAGTQEMGTLWERLVQPQLFTLLLARYGGTEVVNGSRHARDKIANGQCIVVRRDAYERLGGHAAVREKVAEDVALAQRFFACGERTVLVLGLAQLSTRMYTSLGELVRGWGKNIYAGGVDTVPGGAVGRALFPLLLLLPPLMLLAPPLALAAGALGLASPGVVAWAAVSTAITVLWWALVYLLLRRSPLHALLYPLGSAVLLWIVAGAIARGRRVQWKGRTYKAH